MITAGRGSQVAITIGPCRRESPYEQCSRRPRTRRRAVPEPRALVARLQRARPRARRGRVAAAARTGEVPRDLQLQPRRVLPGARLGPAGATRGRRAQQRARRTRPGRAAPRDPSAGRGARRAARRACSPRKSRPRSRRPASSSPTGTTSSDDDQAQLTREFEDRIFPVLTPLAVDPAHPFPYISNLSLNLAVAVRDPDTGEQRFARVKVPPLLPRFVALARAAPASSPLEQVIAAHLDALFPGMEVLAHYPFRVTRDADFELTDEAEDLLAAMESVLRQRTKFGVAVRLEVDSHMTPDVLDLLVPRARAQPRKTSTSSTVRSTCRGCGTLYALRRPELKYATLHAADAAGARGRRRSRRAGGRCATATCWCTTRTTRSARRSKRSSTKPRATPRSSRSSRRCTAPAATRPASSQSLVKAAEAGKQVVALVELKARFDEQANIERARMLEQAGAHVVYGLVGLKTHAKILLVVRQEADGIRRYCHVGTGNYNPKTATTYEDLGVLSADPDLGADLSELFNHLTGYSRAGRVPAAHRRADAPARRRSQELIRGQAHPGGRITMKMNSLVDAAIIDELYAASAAGARIELVVRGICCLRPGVPGLSENITVRSIVGRYLEHSRICRFGEPGADGAEYLIGSADMMPPQPRPARRGDAARHRTPPAGPARRDPRAQPRRRRPRVDARPPTEPGTKCRAVVGLRIARTVPRARRRTREGARHRLMPQLDRERSRRRRDPRRDCGRRRAAARARRRCATRRRPGRRAPGASRGAAAALRPADVPATSCDPEWASDLRAELRLARRRARRGPRHRGDARASARRRRARCPTPSKTQPNASCAACSPTGTRARTEMLSALAVAALRRAARPARRGRRPRRSLTERATELAVDVVPGVVQKPWRKLQAAVDRPRRPHRPTRRCTSVRIQAKRTRYAAEAAMPVFGKARPAVREERWPRCRTCSASTRTRSLRARGSTKTAHECSAPEAFAAGMLAEREAAAAARARADFPAAWAAARAKRLRTWL